jgi:hypothetical protein
MTLGKLEHLFANVVDSRDEQRSDVVPVLWQRMHRLADETLATNGVLRVMDALSRKSSRGAFKGFVAIGKADDE